jgi:hypothetical protein
MKIDAPIGYEVPQLLKTMPVKAKYCLYAHKSTESEESRFFL